MSKFMVAQQAEGYFKKDNYYQETAFSQGQIIGNGLKGLGLKKGEAIDNKTFSKLLNGLGPNGEKLSRNIGQKNRRAGFDVCFSAPKSVSLLAHASDIQGFADIRDIIVKEHVRAVKKTLTVLNKYIKAQYKKNGQVQHMAGDFSGVSFTHDTTRETDKGKIDPHLHTHNFIFSFVKTKDGFKSIENIDVFRNKLFLGQVYRNELAKNLISKGFDIEVTNKRQGFFELKNFAKEETINEFSGRSAMLNKALTKYKKKEKIETTFYDSKLKNIINAKTKKAKNKNEELRANIYAENTIRLNKLNVNVENYLENKEEVILGELRKETINEAINILAETKCLLKKEDILRYSLQLNLDRGTGIKEVKEAFKKEVKENKLIKIEDNYYTTPELLIKEKEILEYIEEQDTTELEINRDEKLSRKLIKKYDFTNGQKDFFNSLLFSKDKNIIVQGDAGTGKTYALQAVKKYLDKNKINILGAAFTGKAAEELKEAGIESFTLHKLLNDKKLEKLKDGGIIVVDEASMIGTRQMHELIEKIKYNKKIKICFMGDVKQFASISAGNIFKDIQDINKSKVIELKEVLRQKTQSLKKVVKKLKDKDIDNALRHLGKNLKEEAEMDAIKSISKAFYKADKKNNKDLSTNLTITSKNNTKDILNLEIRDKLTFKGEEQSIKTLYSLKITEKDKIFKDKVFEEGDIVTTNKAIKGYRAGSKDILKKVEKDFLLMESGKKINLNDLNKIAIYREKALLLHEGETIIFTKNDNNLKIKNGQRDRVKIIKDNILFTQSGKEIDLKAYNYIDYGYAVTDYKAQGTSIDNVFVYADANIASYNSLYTQITRAKKEIKLYTNNIDLLTKNAKTEIIKTSTFKVYKREKLRKEAEKDLNNYVLELKQIYTDKSKIDDNVLQYFDKDRFLKCQNEAENSLRNKKTNPFILKNLKKLIATAETNFLLIQKLKEEKREEERLQAIEEKIALENYYKYLPKLISLENEVNQLERYSCVYNLAGKFYCKKEECIEDKIINENIIKELTILIKNMNEEIEREQVLMLKEIKEKEREQVLMLKEIKEEIKEEREKIKQEIKNPSKNNRVSEHEFLEVLKNENLQIYSETQDCVFFYNKKNILLQAIKVDSYTSEEDLCSLSVVKNDDYRQYLPNLLNSNKKIDALDSFLEKSNNITYTVIDNELIITEKEKEAPNFFDGDLQKTFNPLKININLKTGVGRVSDDQYNVDITIQDIEALCLENKNSEKEIEEISIDDYLKQEQKQQQYYYNEPSGPSF